MTLLSGDAEAEHVQARMRATLDRFATELWEQREQILQLWHANVEADGTLHDNMQLSWQQFADHIPYILQTLCEQWREWPLAHKASERERQTARSHAQHRWQQGYNIRSLTREWGHFNSALLETIDHITFDLATTASGESGEQEHSVVSRVSSEVAEQPDILARAGRMARAMAAQLLTESMTGSIVQHSELLQTEATIRGREMEIIIEQLRAEERERGRVLREAAHDLRGSLCIVTGSASIIDREGLQVDERAQVHRLLQSGVRSLHDMMTDLIDLSRLEAGAEQMLIQPFDVSVALCELCDTVRPLAEKKNLELRCTGAPSLLVEGDEIKVRRIVQNLLLNAIYYTQSGRVALSWAEYDQKRWSITVQDSGPGFSSSSAPIAQALQEATAVARDAQTSQPAEISAQNLESSMEKSTPFGQHSRGEGVGLAIVKRLCALMNASIELDSQSGIGATFRIILPRHYTAKPTSTTT